MTEFREYVIQPGTLISLGVFLFGLGATYIRITGKIQRNEEKIEELAKTTGEKIGKLEKEVSDIDGEGIKVTLAQIQADLSRIKMEIMKKNKK